MDDTNKPRRITWIIAQDKTMFFTGTIPGASAWARNPKSAEAFDSMEQAQKVANTLSVSGQLTIHNINEIHQSFPRRITSIIVDHDGNADFYFSDTGREPFTHAEYKAGSESRMLLTGIEYAINAFNQYQAGLKPID